MRRIIVIAAAILAVVLALDAYPGLRGGAGWQWAYEAPADWLPIVALSAALAAYVIVTPIVRRRAPLRRALNWTVFSGMVLAYLVVGVRGDPRFLLFTRTVSPVQTGASALQARIMAEEGVLQALQRWPQIMDEALAQNLIHFTTSPPGQVLLHQAAADIFDAPALDFFSRRFNTTLRQYQCGDVDVMRYTRGEIVSAGLFAYLMPLFAAMAALPVYLITRDLTDDEGLALRVAGWWPLVPAALMFAPTWNTVYPTLCATAFWLLLRALLTSRLRWALASGVVMGLTTLLNFAVLPFFLLAGLFTLGWYFGGPAEQQRALTTEHTENHGAHREVTRTSFFANRPKPIAQSLFVGLVFGAGVLAPWIVFTLATGVSPLEVLSKTFGAHAELVRRDYLPWLVLHPYDVLLFTGLPAAALAIWSVVRTLRSRQFDVLGVFALSMALTVVLVDVAGIVQGENARILIFYMPFLLIAGAGALRGVNDGPLLGAQAVVLLAMAAVLAVVPLDLDPMPTAPRTDIGSLGDVAWTDANAAFESAAFDGAFALDRYRWVGDPSRQAITYEFEFAGGVPTERPYQFELVARADSDMGEIVSEPFRWWSQGEEYPPTCWRDGDLVRDTIVMPVPPVPHPVVWDVILRAVDERTGDAMLTGGENALTLAPVRYP